MLLAGAALICLIVFAFAASDRVGPVITYSGDTMLYREGDDKQMLLMGVSAMDERDGDVSASLIVENIIPLSDDGSARVIYAARDKHNNISKVSRLISYVPLPVAEEPDTSALSENAAAGVDAGNAFPGGVAGTVNGVSDNAAQEVLAGEDGQAAQDGAEQDGDGQEDTDAQSEDARDETAGDGNEDAQGEGTQDQGADAAGETPQDTAADVQADAAQGPDGSPDIAENVPVPPTPFDETAVNPAMHDIIQNAVASQTEGAPSISLTTNSITSYVGDSINKYAYIAGASDDKDYAMHFVHVDGDVDISMPGDYSLRYYVLDSDGNRSNVETLHVKVIQR